MLCQFAKLIYPQNIKSITPSSYMVALYRPCENILDKYGHSILNFKAVGYSLPMAEKISYDMKGCWSNSPKHGIQFNVETYDEVIPPTREGIIAYLSSGQIRGIGETLAERIYDAFGNETLKILDEEPERLLEVSGISEKKLQFIADSYLESRGARDVVGFLVPRGVTANRAVELYKQYGNKTLEVLTSNPYKLCELPGIGFLTADKIAMGMNFKKLSYERVDNGMLYVLSEAETRGNVCMEKHEFIKSALKLLDTPELTEEMLANRAARLVASGELVTYGDMVFSDKIAQVEQTLAAGIALQLLLPSKREYPDLNKQLDEEEKSLKLRMAPEQKEAVKMALTNSLSVITGGPGTGKTLIQKVILDIFMKNNQNCRVMLCAPTGRAARRMSTATGYPAATVHKALGLLFGTNGIVNRPTLIDADLILVDEASMLDVYIANYLFKSIKRGTQVIFIGDADQLPSVGPGAVLADMILCEKIPVVKLDKVFRQRTGSRIAINAKLIKHGNLSLEYGPDFEFDVSSDLAESSDIINKIYLDEIAKYGIDNVALLSPYRQKTETGTNALNEKIRESVNPQDGKKKEFCFGKKTFRVGDKVLQTKNHNDVNNGDVGIVTDISVSAGETVLKVDFGYGKIEEYYDKDLDMLDFGYALTVHKSQGSEYKSVIISLQNAHLIMLNRQLVYTAITRGKERVIIVGDRKALCIAIKRTESETRGTCLKERIIKTLEQIDKIGGIA